MTRTSVANGVDQLEQRVAEACDSLWDALVDPNEAYADDDGLCWTQVTGERPPDGSPQTPYFDQRQHAEIRRQCRWLAATNEFAINGIENRISYLIGVGHSYRAVVRKAADAPATLAAEVQSVLDEFLHVNRWQARQQEIVRRLDRDGEVFVRHFLSDDGVTRLRFVEPEQVVAPKELGDRPEASFGVLTKPHDVETALAYFIDGQRIDADEIQHRKANVDANVKRGLPLFYPVRKNLRRVDKLLRNMSVVAEIQSAIALIRKHQGATRGTVEQFATDQSSAQRVDATTGRTRRFAQFAPGTILDAPVGLDYDFPASGIDASAFVAVLQAELRAIAARLVMPEFMFTSDASNANYSSTLVAEGPAMRMFERLQATMRLDDCAIMWRVVENAISSGRLTEAARHLIEIQITPPSLELRDQLRACQVERIAYEAGVLSPQTWSQRLGLDYDQEQKNFAMHK